MAKVTIWQNGRKNEVSFSGKRPLSQVLAENGYSVDHPCGGRGVCGKCAVRLEGAVSPPNAAEEKAGVRLSCQAELWGDAQVWLPDTQRNEIELSGGAAVQGDGNQSGVGAAVDIGTTTLALKLYDLKTGAQLASAAAMNPQRSVAADVMGRIGAALEGQGGLLKTQIEDAIGALLQEACASAGIPAGDVRKLVVAGNTTMLYLLTGRNPLCLSRAPFQADHLFDERAILLGIPVYYPPCMNAFVGADITCAVLASGMCEKSETSLLCDIGTNGEIALWKDGVLYVTSTAAGPAFEGAGISCGCGSVPGAIDRVWVENGEIQAHTLGNQAAVGVCGSGLIDAIAAFLKTEDIDETGAVEEDELPLRDGISLKPQDVRAVQLAKAAIAAGIQTLMQLAEIRESDIARLYIAGGFGSHLNVESAAAIGLIPGSLTDKVTVIGNGSLSGSGAMLLREERLAAGRALAKGSRHVNLGGNPRFNENYMEQILFETE